MSGDQIGAARLAALRCQAAALAGQVRAVSARLEGLERVNADMAIRAGGKMLNLGLRLDAILADLPANRKNGRAGARP